MKRRRAQCRDGAVGAGHCRGGGLSSGAAGSVQRRQARCRGGGLGAGAAGSMPEQRAEPVHGDGAAGSMAGRRAQCRGGRLSAGAPGGLSSSARAVASVGGGLGLTLAVQGRWTDVHGAWAVGLGAGNRAVLSAGNRTEGISPS